MSSDAKRKPIVRLWDHVGIGLIFPWASGVLYSNQTGGTSCLSPQIEGIFVPIGNDALIDHKEGWLLCSKEPELWAYFKNGPWKGSGAIHGIDEYDANFIDALLHEMPSLPFIRVDREKLSDSHEAWVHVIVEPDIHDTELSIFAGFDPFPRRAILTWTNTD